MNVKSFNNTSKWQMGFNSAFKGLMSVFDVPLPALQQTDGLPQNVVQISCNWGIR
jgi:hypothetical protein